MPNYHHGSAGIVISSNDSFTLTNDIDGDPAVRIENAVWVEEPMFLAFEDDSRSSEHAARQLADVLARVAEEMQTRRIQREESLR